MVGFCYDRTAPLERLKHREKDALIQGLWQELQTLRKELESLKQNRVKKT
jgi:transposase